MKLCEIAALVGAAVATAALANLVFQGPGETAALAIGGVGCAVLVGSMLFDWR